MSEYLLMRAPHGFVPANDEEGARLSKFKLGAVMRANVAEMRNGKYFRKWWVLSKFAFDIWADRQPEQEWRGVKVLPDFERFRRDLIIMAGFFRPVWAVNGELRLEAESLAWAKMDEDRFAALYSATINAILQKIIPDAGYTEDRLRATVDTLLGEFA